ncbi:hypothetical protein ACFQGT_18175 [Natrialbaceae archaeon GCM10025810]|uniref:hypothetical protein n=1 Tax=Halovalidus salilacus TaxID=3075124 RepID=UPI00360AB82C
MTKSTTETEAQTPGDGAVRSTAAAESRLDRRTLLQLLGIVTVPAATATQPVAAATSVDYGAGGYGEGPYPGGSGDDATPESPSPDVVTDSPTAVGTETATLQGELVDTDGADVVTVAFAWRATDSDSWTTTASQDLPAADEFSTELPDLANDTTYEVRAIADVDGAGEEVRGERRTFTTDAAAAEPPQIDTFDLTEDSPPNPHAELHVEWAVSHAEGALEQVTIEVVDTADSTSPVATETMSVDGASASGSETFTIKRGSGAEYRAVLAVTAGDETVSDDRTVQA